MTAQFVETIKKLLRAHYYDEAYQLFFKYYKKVQKDASIVMMERIFQIYAKEKEAGLYHLFHISGTWEDAIAHYTNVKFLLRRIDFELPEGLQNEVFEYIRQNRVSGPFLEAVIDASVLHKKKVAGFIDRMGHI